MERDDAWVIVPEDRHFMARAMRAAMISKAQTKVGCLIVNPLGYVSIAMNGPPDVLAEFDCWHEHDRRDFLLCHAEEAALVSHHDWNNATLYCTAFPCATCARLIIAAGVARVVAPMPDFKDPKWGLSWEAATDMFIGTGMVLVPWEATHDEEDSVRPRDERPAQHTVGSPQRPRKLYPLRRPD